MELYLLGTGTLVPEAERGPSSYGLEGPGGLALVDTGWGALGRLAGIGLDFREVGDLLYTHRHPDHTADLVPFLFARKYAEPEGDGGIRILGPEGFPAFVAALQQAWCGWATPGDDDYDLEVATVPTEARAFEIVGLEARAFPVQHSDPGAVAYRFTDPATGGVLCYTGDTDLCDGVLDAARDADVLVVECSMPDDRPVEGHLTPKKAAIVAAESGARRIILVHLYPVQPLERYRVACQDRLGRPVEIGRDGMSVRL